MYMIPQKVAKNPIKSSRYLALRNALNIESDLSIASLKMQRYEAAKNNKNP